MKKILLATTALVGFAGAAAAEVKLSGYAEIGIRGGDNIETQFHNDIDVTFNLSGASDSGLEFGATIDLDELNGDNINPTAGGNGCGGPSSSNPGCENDSSVWVSGSFGKVTLGDTDGALDWAAAELSIGTAIADDHTSQAGYYSFTGLDGTHDGQVMRYEYSFGDFAAAFSAEIDDTGVDDPTIGVGVKWSGDMGGTAVSAGLGYQSGEIGGVSLDATALSVDATFANGISARLGYATGNIGYSTVDYDWVGFGLGYTMDALKVQALWGQWSTSGAPDVDGWGLMANYDLGGGAVAMFGYGDGDTAGSPYAAGGSHWSAGLGLSF